MSCDFTAQYTIIQILCEVMTINVKFEVIWPETF